MLYMFTFNFFFADFEHVPIWFLTFQTHCTFRPNDQAWNALLNHLNHVLA